MLSEIIEATESTRTTMEESDFIVIQSVMRVASGKSRECSISYLQNPHTYTPVCHSNSSSSQLYTAMIQFLNTVLPRSISAGLMLLVRHSHQLLTNQLASRAQNSEGAYIKLVPRPYSGQRSSSNTKRALIMLPMIPFSPSHLFK